MYGDVGAHRAGCAGHEQSPSVVRCHTQEVHELGCGGGVERYRRCLDQVQAIRYHGDIRSRDEEMLGMGSVVAIETVDEPGDTGAAWQFNDGAGGLNSSGEVDRKSTRLNSSH